MTSGERRNVLLPLLLLLAIIVGGAAGYQSNLQRVRKAIDDNASQRAVARERATGWLRESQDRVAAVKRAEQERQNAEARRLRETQERERAARDAYYTAAISALEELEKLHSELDVGVNYRHYSDALRTAHVAAKQFLITYENGPESKLPSYKSIGLADESLTLAVKAWRLQLDLSEGSPSYEKTERIIQSCWNGAGASLQSARKQLAEGK